MIATEIDGGRVAECTLFCINRYRKLDIRIYTDSR